MSRTYKAERTHDARRPIDKSKFTRAVLQRMIEDEDGSYELRKQEEKE